MQVKLLEELLERCWMLIEEGQPITAENLSNPPLAHRDEGEKVEDILQRAGELKLLEKKPEGLVLTEKGEAKAGEIIRRHRLAERLLEDVFQVYDPELEDAACDFEHVLNPEVTDKICAFLGHPKECPHGKPIPPGEDCSKPEATLQPLVAPLSRLLPGEEGKISFISSSRHNFMQKLSALGVNPGTPLKLLQKSPSYIIKIAEMEIALEEDAAREIYVKRS